MNWDYLGSVMPKAIHTLPSRCQSHVRIFPCFCPSHCGLAGCLSPNGAEANHSPVTTSLLCRSEFRIWDDSSGRKLSLDKILPQTVRFSFVLMILVMPFKTASLILKKLSRGPAKLHFESNFPVQLLRQDLSQSSLSKLPLAQILTVT